MPRVLLALILTLSAQLPEGLGFELCLCALFGHGEGACAPEASGSCCDEGEREMPAPAAEGGADCACCWVLETRTHEDGTRTSPQRTPIGAPPRAGVVVVACDSCEGELAIQVRKREAPLERRVTLPLRI